MKVIDFWSGCPTAVRINWRDNNPWWPAFLDQSLISDVLGGIPNEIHCYDSLALPKEETKQHLIGTIGQIVLHSDKRRLPRRVDMICAFHPDPRVIFWDQDKYDFNQKKTLAYSKYVSELAIMVDFRLRVGGILAVQFDDCMASSEQPYDGTRPFLARALPEASDYYMKRIWYAHQSETHRPIRPFEWLESYEFDSLHIFQKVPSKK